MLTTGFESVHHLLQCFADVDYAADCACLQSGGGPAMNTDISGPGVRISFYLQAYFLSLLSARSGSLEEITAALYTLVATNIAMTIASFILGFKSEPTMSLQDALVVFYLLTLSWASVFTSMPAYNRFVRSDKTLKVVSVFQSYLIFALGLAVLIRAPTFGSTPRCNLHAVTVVFRPFPLLDASRIVAIFVLSAVMLFYTALTFTDYHRSVIRQCLRFKHWAFFSGFFTAMYTPSVVKGKTREEIPTSAATGRKVGREGRETTSKHTWNGDMSSTTRAAKPKGRDFGVSGTLLVELIVITVLWALFVLNTELLILRNHFDGGGDGLNSSTLWQFGQILPMFLAILPLVSLVKVFRKHGLKRRHHRKRVHILHKHHLHRDGSNGNQENFQSDPAAAHSTTDSFATASGTENRRPFFGHGYTPDFFPRSEPPVTANIGSWPAAHISLHSITSSTENHENSNENLQNDRVGRDTSTLSSSS